MRTRKQNKEVYVQSKAGTNIPQRAARALYLRGCSVPKAHSYAPGQGLKRLSVHDCLSQQGFGGLKHDIQGRLGGPVIKRLASAQVVIPAFWDGAPHQASCSAGSLLLPLPLPLLVFPLSLPLSRSNK